VLRKDGKWVIDCHVRPIASLTWTRLIPEMWYSTGSSVVMILVSMSLMA
jgi:hypothetical protein